MRTCNENVGCGGKGACGNILGLSTSSQVVHGDGEGVQDLSVELQLGSEVNLGEDGVKSSDGGSAVNLLTVNKLN